MDHDVHHELYKEHHEPFASVRGRWRCWVIRMHRILSLFVSQCARRRYLWINCVSLFRKDAFSFLQTVSQHSSIQNVKKKHKETIRVDGILAVGTEPLILACVKNCVSWNKLRHNNTFPVRWPPLRMYCTPLCRLCGRLDDLISEPTRAVGATVTAGNVTLIGLPRMARQRPHSLQTGVRPLMSFIGSSDRAGQPLHPPDR